jgi:hypothetical protein
MPDIWTRHPEIVRDLVKEAGFTCGVEGRFLPGRDREWTCIFDGPNMRGDLYIHHVDRLRSEVYPADGPIAHASAFADAGVWGAPAVALLLGVLIGRWRSVRAKHSDP